MKQQQKPRQDVIDVESGCASPLEYYHYPTILKVILEAFILIHFQPLNYGKPNLFMIMFHCNVTINLAHCIFRNGLLMTNNSLLMQQRWRSTTEMKRTHTIVKQLNDDNNPALWNAIEPFTLTHHLWPENDYFPKVQVRTYYSNDSLHVQFRTFEQSPTINYYQLNDPVCKDSCVEFFFQPNPAVDQRYLNFEINAAGTLLLGLGTDVRDLVFLTELDTDSFQIKPTIGLTDPESGQTYWELVFRVPFQFINSLFPDFRAESGAIMNGNFYKCGDETPSPHYLSWNRVTSETADFHRTSDFGQLVFG